jgi:hypothetical protein
MALNFMATGALWGAYKFCRWISMPDDG